MISREAMKTALIDAARKFHPNDLRRMPIMALVAIGAVVCTAIGFYNLANGIPAAFDLQIAGWLWATVYFANIAEAVAEGRGKAQAEALRKMRTTAMARRLRDGSEQRIPASELVVDDLVVCEAGDLVPSDGEVVEGIASIDESAITGESAPVIRESGGDRSAVTGGTTVISDRIVVRITAAQGNAFLDRIIGLVEGATRQRTPNEIALSNLLLGLTVVFLLVVGCLPMFTGFLRDGGFGVADTSPTVLIALAVCLIPTTIGGLLSAIGISGMDRMVRRNVIARSGRAVEAAGDVDVLLLDKTGTITYGNRMATSLMPAPYVSATDLARSAMIASLADDTPEGRSIVALVQTRHAEANDTSGSIRYTAIPFTAQTRMSGADVDRNGTVMEIRKGAVDAVRSYLQERRATIPPECEADARRIAQQGCTPLLVCQDDRVMGVVELKDVVKEGIRERFMQLRSMGIRTVMITGDNPLTAAAIAAEAGVDDFIAEARPEDKLARIRSEQGEGRMVAMIGDGTNDAPALAQADVGVAMNTGTQAAREAGNMVDLDSNPTKLIEIVEIGKQLLMTRGALTTFSIANDVSKYFAILPAMFGALYVASGAEHGPLAVLDIMRLHSPHSAILSAVIVNALLIVLLIPLALRGVAYVPASAAVVLRRNVLIYGVGGLLAPFLFIKLVDLLLTALGFV